MIEHGKREIGVEVLHKSSYRDSLSRGSPTNDLRLSSLREKATDLSCPEERKGCFLNNAEAGQASGWPFIIRIK
jgi:hypothetical protein